MRHAEERHERLRRAAEAARELLQLRQERALLLAEARGEMERRCEVQALQAVAKRLEDYVGARQALRFSTGPPQWDAPMSGVGGDGVWGPWQDGWELRYKVAQTAGQGALHAVAQRPEPIRLQIYRLPFAEGGVRLAFYAR